MKAFLFKPHYSHGLALALVAVASLQAEPTPLETVERSAGDWLKVRAETTRLETEWSTQQRLLNTMVQGLNERVQTLEAKRDYLLAKTAKDREELASLDTSNKSGSAGLDSMDDQLKAMTPRLVELRRSLPPRLSDALAMSYKSLAGTELSVGQRMQLTMTVLNRCLQFNRTIICEDEILDPANEGKTLQLEVIYWGLSHGYALDRSAHKVWLGRPGTQSWQWEPVPNAAERVARLIEINRGKAEPEFIEIPAHLKNQSDEIPQK